MYAARAEARARAPGSEALDPDSCSLFQPLSQHQLGLFAAGDGSDRREMHAQETMMGAADSHFGAEYGGGERMMSRAGNGSGHGVHERMMLGSEYGHGGTAYPYPTAQSYVGANTSSRGSSGRRSGAGGSSRRGVASGGRSGATGYAQAQATRRPLAPRLDVSVSRCHMSSGTSGYGLLDPLEGLGGLGTF